MRPVDDHLVGVREPGRGGEHRPGVADRDLVAEERADPGDRGGEVDRAEDEHPRLGRERPRRTPASPRRGARRRGRRSGSRCGRRRAARGRRRVTASSGRAASRACRLGVVRRRSGPHDEPAARAGPGRGARSRWHTATGRPASMSAATSPSSGNVSAVDLLDEDVEDAAAGQPDGERVVVADAVALQHRARRTRPPPGRARRPRPRRSRRTRCRPPRRPGRPASTRRPARGADRDTVATTVPPPPTGLAVARHHADAARGSTSRTRAPPRRSSANVASECPARRSSTVRQGRGDPALHRLVARPCRGAG